METVYDRCVSSFVQKQILGAWLSYLLEERPMDANGSSEVKENPDGTVNKYKATLPAKVFTSE